METTEISASAEALSDSTDIQIAELGSDLKENGHLERPALFSNKTLFELSKAEWLSTRSAEKPEGQPYVRGCEWSPDGTCCLCVVNGRGVHLVELPRDLYTEGPSRHRDVDPLTSAIHVPEAGLIYDYCWYPGMNSGVPETCCWLTTRQHGPVQMWDAFDGGLRCSYRGFDAVDEMEPALSVTFAAGGELIYAGYKKCLRTFHTSRPGRDCSVHPLKAPAACLATSGKLLAVGSWNTSLSLYNINEAGTFKSIGKMHGHAGGVTHITFSPDGTELVAGARKDPRLLVFDLRHYGRPLRALARRVDTNQRVYFDVSPCGRYLASGGTDGVLRVWGEEAGWRSREGELDDSPTYMFPLHTDCLNSVSIHPYRPIVATGSGQYHTPDPTVSLHHTADMRRQTMDKVVDVNLSPARCDTRSDGSDISESRNGAATESDESLDVVDSAKSENSLVFWWIGSVPDL